MEGAIMIITGTGTAGTEIMIVMTAGDSPLQSLPASPLWVRQVRLGAKGPSTDRVGILGVRLEQSWLNTAASSRLMDVGLTVD